MRMRATLCLSVAMLAGCGSNPIGPIRDMVLSNEAESKALFGKAQRGEGVQGALTNPNVEHIDGFWLPARKAAESDAETFSAKASSRRISINRGFADLQSVAEWLSSIVGMPVLVSPDVARDLSQTAGGGAATATRTSASAAPRLPALGGGPSPGLPFPTATSSTGDANSSPIWLTYDGKLSGFLDLAAARFGASWEWLPSRGVRFFRYKTKVFRVFALPGDTSLATTVSNQTGGGGGGSAGGTAGGTTGGVSISTSSGQQAGLSYTALSVWNGIGDQVKGMLSRDGKMTVAQATGTITVTDTPEVIKQVEHFISEQNASLSKQVIVNVRVLSVKVSGGDNYGINWNLVYQELKGGRFGFNFNNAFASAENSSNLTLKILGTAGAASGTGSAWQGSDVLISALSKQGHVSQITSASLTTLNNQVAPLQVGTQTTFLASSSTVAGTANSPPITTLTPGNLTTGFSMALVPHMLDQGRLLLQYAINISSLLSLETIRTTNSMIQLPNVDTRNFLQRVSLNSGDTLVMTGFEQTGATANGSGVASAENYALGGGVATDQARNVLVILIQPVVVAR